jgi:hypothetical protein
MLLVKRKHNGKSSIYKGSLIATEIPIGTSTYRSVNGIDFISATQRSVTLDELASSCSNVGVIQINEYKDLKTGISSKKKVVLVKEADKYEVRFNPW